MRFAKTVLALTAVFSMQGCLAAARALEGIAPKCLQEQIVVTWPIATTRGGATTSVLLTKTLTQNDIDRPQFDALKDALTSTGSSAKYTVTWAVPAFAVNGGHIGFTHSVPMTTGETQQVSSAFLGGGWGAQPATASVPATISLRADNFVATSASGSISALAGSPLRLRIDVTTANAAGETIKVAGDVGFSYFKVTALCQ